MLSQLWKIFRMAFLVGGVLLSFLVFSEILQVYSHLYEINHSVAYIFIAVLIIGGTFLIGYVIVVVSSLPPIVIPPKVSDVSSASPRELKKYRNYLRKYVTRLDQNRNLDETARKFLMKYKDELSQEASAQGDVGQLLKELETGILQNVTQCLDNRAEQEIRKSVRDNMLAVTLSPYRSIDVLVVLYRNVFMVIRIGKIYNNRPHFKDQFVILKDVLKVVATVNYLNFADKLLEGLCSGIPWIGKYADELAQGMGAGFFTSITGHTAKSRCQGIGHYSYEDSEKHLKENIGHFLADVRTIAMEESPNLLRSLTKRFGKKQLEEKDLKDAAEKIDTTLEELGQSPESFWDWRRILKPWSRTNKYE